MYDTSLEVIEALRAKTGATSDAAVARLLGVSHVTVVHWRAGRCAMSPEVAVRAAELLGVDPGPLLLRRFAEMEKDAAARAIIVRMADKLQRGVRRARRVAVLGALAVAAGAGIGAPAPSHAAVSDPGMYIMSYC